MNNSNKVFNEDLYFETDSLEKMISDYIDNPNVIINLVNSEDSRCLRIQFNNWYKFKNKNHTFVNLRSIFHIYHQNKHLILLVQMIVYGIKRIKRCKVKMIILKKDNKWIKKEINDLDDEIRKIQNFELKNNKKVLRNLESPSTISTKSTFSPRPYLVSPTPISVVNSMFANKNNDDESDDEEYNDYSDLYYEQYHNKKFISISDREYNDYEDDEYYENLEYDDYEN